MFYPDIDEQEKDLRHLLNKFAACTEEERRFLSETADFMVEQFIHHRNEGTPDKKVE